jgi:hypothetical protein
MDKHKDNFTDLVGSANNGSDNPDNNLADNQVVGSDGTVIDLGNDAGSAINKVIER